MKKIITRHLMIFLLITFVGNFSFAVDTGTAEKIYCETQSSICGTAPDDFTLLLDFVREMINSIKTIGTEGDYIGKYVNPNRFNGALFAPPTKSIKSKITQNIEQKIKFGLASTAIFANPTNFAGLKDIAGGTILLQKNKVFLRDARLVEELESQLSDKKYELGVGGGWYEKIIPENLKIMQAIIGKYIDKGLFDDNYKIENVSYTTITSLLTQILSAAKSFLYFDNVSQFGEISRGGVDGIIIIFNADTLEHIQRQYRCARSPYFVCSSELKKLESGWSKMWQNLTLGSSSSKKTFEDAIDRLGQIFSKNKTTDFKTREAELLNSLYGTFKGNQKTTRGTLIDFDFDQNNGNSATAGDILDGAKTLGAGIANVAGDILDGAKTLGAGIANVASRSWTLLTKDIWAKKEELQNIMGSTTTSQDTFVTLMNAYVSDVFANQAMDIELATFSEVKDITPAFTILGNQINVIKKDILGGKEKNNSLLKNLGVACELQCGRWGLCR